MLFRILSHKLNSIFEFFNFYAGININQKSVGLEFIKSELRKKCACILLVDANLLHGKNLDDDDLGDLVDLSDDMSRSNLKVSSIKSATNCCFQFNGSDKIHNDYLGHFVVIIGYDDLKSIIYYRNPATEKKLSYTSYFNMDMARQSYGTDQDLLFIYI